MAVKFVIQVWAQRNWTDWSITDDQEEAEEFVADINGKYGQVSARVVPLSAHDVASITQDV